MCGWLLARQCAGDCGVPRQFGTGNSNVTHNTCHGLMGQLVHKENGATMGSVFHVEISNQLMDNGVRGESELLSSSFLR